MLPLSSAFVLCALAGLGSALNVIGPSGDLHVVNAELAPDGTSRSTVVVNGQFPGPVIRGVKGDRFSLNVIDELHDNTMLQSTSIHWHGLFQHGTNYADGPSFVTQCPIARNHSFLYDFEVPDQAGSFWYHSHLSTQYCDGLRGALVVYDGEDGVNDPHRALYDVDDETTIITLADWYQLPSPQLLLVPGAKMANTTLINGKGRFGGNPTAELAVINVTPGKRYRFRIISISCDPNFIFSIDGHNLTLIETDGENITPITVNAVDVFAGQRYSAILEATQPVGNYWVRAQPNINQFTDFENGINSAILRYDGADIAEPTTSSPPDLVPVSESALHPLDAREVPGRPFPGGADVVLNMEVGFDPVTQLFSINNNSFFPPTVPVLLQILSGTQRAQDLLPSGSVFGLPLNRSVEINLFGGSAPGSPHPFHLHGHTFDVVKTWDSDTFNFVDPVRRDVTPVFAGNLTTLRFNTDNPGPWFLHCHIDFHLDAGLAVVMAEDVPDVKFTEEIPASWKELCPIYDAVPEDQL